MLYSYRTEQALRAASILHKDQVRKGSIPIPYVSHLMAVATIVRDYSDDEDVFITALLHDTLEDTDYTAEELKDDFGGVICELVTTISEPKDSPDRSYSWLQRKEQYLKQLTVAPENACIVATADKIHNLRTIIEEYFEHPEQYLADYGSTVEERRMVYQKLHKILNERVQNAIINEFNHVYEEYQAFITSIERTKEQEFE